MLARARSEERGAGSREQGNPKSEIRNPKQISNPKIETQNDGPHPRPLSPGTMYPWSGRGEAAPSPPAPLPEAPRTHGRGGGSIAGNNCGLLRLITSEYSHLLFENSMILRRARAKARRVGSGRQPTVCGQWRWSALFPRQILADHGPWRPLRPWCDDPRLRFGFLRWASLALRPSHDGPRLRFGFL